ncbi:atypical chemokine receptor 2, partial [Ambystoma mexicanum]|uniref:atypical chemokine receptor 2 n=1 Tax=Ambystoma mexicanum TaxID=8296 RepID=UPI0037E7879A
MTLGTEQNDYEYDYYNYTSFYICAKQSIKTFGKVFLPVLYTLVFVLGLLGNVLLFILLIKYIKHKSMTEIYLMNMCVSDLLFVLTLPFWSVYAASEWMFGNILCKLISTFYAVNFFSGIFFINCMSLDMYLVIVHAWSRRNQRTRSKGFLVTSIMWIIALLFSVPDMIFSRVMHHNGRQTCDHDYGELNFIWKLILKFQLNVLGFLLPFLCMVFFYCRISVSLIAFKADDKERALKLIVIPVTVFFVLWFPYNVVVFLHSLQDLHVISDCDTSKHLDFAMQVTEGLAFLHCCLNPFLYAFVNKRFKRYLNKIAGAISSKNNMFVLQTSQTTKSSTKNADMEM